MSVTRQNLEEKFRLFNDEELRRLYHSDDLTELAKEVAAAELQQRGLDLARPPVAVASEEPSKTPIGQAYERPPDRSTSLWLTKLFQLLFGLSGRINRAKYWLAIVIFSVTMLIVLIVVSFAAWIVGDITLGLLPFVIAVIIYTLLLISFIAIGIKRLHDRDKSGWWLLVFYVLPAVLSSIAEAAGTGLQFIFSLAILALWIWGFVELGCLCGTAGPNKYGSDPLVS
jgi:uncharacterized membrane protein YhaH (DUF805 family)